MIYAAYLCGLAAIVTAIVALLRITSTHSILFYTVLALLEVAAIVLVLATEYGYRTNGPRRLGVRYVLAAHGSSSPEANDAVRGVAASLGVMLRAPVRAAFLERCAPTIFDALVQAAEEEPGVVVLVPFFLMPGLHVRHDLTEIVASAREKTGGRIELGEYLGAHESVPALLAQIATRATEQSTAV